jgi:site-specific DNA-methyltransferase (adenine-specific)
MNRNAHRPHGRNGTATVLPRPAWWTTDEWETPPEFVAGLEAEFGPFTLDPCARAENAKAPRFYTKQEDGLTRPWFGRVWINPPYSNPRLWVKRAWDEHCAGHTDLIVLLLPASTDTGWFHDYCYGKAEVRLLRGRIRFWGWERTPIGAPTSGSMLVIYKPAPRAAKEEQA